MRLDSITDFGRLAPRPDSPRLANGVAGLSSF
jgi:hypothetical protein